MAKRNIIDAIIEIVNSPKHRLKQYSSSLNRANDMGSALEDYCKDIFAGTVGETDREKRITKINEVFSYTGNQNNPPDIILKGGDAIEVKKIMSPNATIALNSSYPKCKLYSDSTLITQECKNCDGGNWGEKDMLYIIGVVNGDNLRSLAMVYGDDYCDSKEVYEKIRTAIKTGILSIPDVDFSETNELGRVNKVDHLGITYLRIRGMWHIDNPFKVFDYIYKRNDAHTFDLMVIINQEKIKKLSNFKLLESMEKTNASLKILDKKIQDSRNPAKLKDVKLISYYVK
jgi:hypothetical protein